MSPHKQEETAVTPKDEADGDSTKEHKTPHLPLWLCLTALKLICSQATEDGEVHTCLMPPLSRTSPGPALSSVRWSLSKRSPSPFRHIPQITINIPLLPNSCSCPASKEKEAVPAAHGQPPPPPARCPISMVSPHFS